MFGLSMVLAIIIMIWLLYRPVTKVLGTNQIAGVVISIIMLVIGMGLMSILDTCEKNKWPIWPITLTLAVLLAVRVVFAIRRSRNERD